MKLACANEMLPSDLLTVSQVTTLHLHQTKHVARHQLLVDASRVTCWFVLD